MIILFTRTTGSVGRQIISGRPRAGVAARPTSRGPRLGA